MKTDMSRSLLTKSEVLTTEELAKLLRMKESTLYRKLKKGDLPEPFLRNPHRWSATKIRDWMSGL